MQNGQEHIAEPLDYLYEELPPERMAEVKRHLAECPECRARMREIRDTVKAYRQAPHPQPPPGLAARVADAAIKEADTGAVGLLRGRIPSAASLAASLDHMAAEPAPSPREREAKMEEEFEKLKDELRGEMRRGWSSWLFHPAWAVAASVAFLFALALHFSPRYGRYHETVYVRPGIETLNGEDRGHAVAAQSPVAADMPPRGDLSPSLQQAKMQRETALAAQPRRAAPPPAQPAPAAPSMEPAAAPAPELAMAEASAPDQLSLQSETDSLPEADEILLAEAAPEESVDDALFLDRRRDHAVSAARPAQSARKDVAGKLRPPASPRSVPTAEQKSFKPAETELAFAMPPQISAPEPAPTPSIAASSASADRSSMRPPEPIFEEAKTPGLYTIPIPSATEARDVDRDTLYPSLGAAAPTLSPTVQDFSSLPPLDLSSAPITGRQDAGGPDMEGDTAYSGGSAADLSVSGPAVAFGAGAFVPPDDGGVPSASLPPPPAIYEGEDLYATGVPDMDGAIRDSDEKSEVVVLDMLNAMEPPQLIARPDTGDVRERIQSLTTLAGMQMANGEIADAWKTIEMLRRYDSKAAETLAELLREIEQAALAETEAPEKQADASAAAVSASMADLPAPASSAPLETVPSAAGATTTSKYDSLSLPPKREAVEQEPAAAGQQTPPAIYESAPIPVPEDIAPARPLSFVGEMVEPPEDPPMTLVRVPPSVTPPAAYDAPADVAVPESLSLRQRGNGSRAAALVQTLSEALPVEPAAPSSAPYGDNGGWSAEPVEAYPVPAFTPSETIDPAPQSPPRNPAKRPFTTDPYLRDY